MSIATLVFLPALLPHLIYFQSFISFLLPFLGRMALASHLKLPFPHPALASSPTQQRVP